MRKWEWKGWEEEARRRCRCWGPAGYDPRGEHTTPETASVWESRLLRRAKSNCRPFLLESLVRIDEECPLERDYRLRSLLATDISLPCGPEGSFVASKYLPFHRRVREPNRILFIDITVERCSIRQAAIVRHRNFFGHQVKLYRLRSPITAHWFR